MANIIPLIPRDNPDIRVPVRDVLKTHSTVEVVRAVEAGDDTAADKLVHALVSGGWVGLALPEEFGGGGAQWSDLDLALFELGRAAAPVAYRSSLTTGLFLNTVFPTVEGAQKVIADITAGSVWTSAVSEPATPYEIAAVERDGRLYGRKSYVFDVPGAAGLLVAVRGTGGGYDWYFTQENAPGIAIIATPSTAGEPQHDVVFDGAVAELVGRSSEASLTTWVTIQRFVQAAWACGLMARTIEMAAEYVGIRHQFGRPIGSFQSVQHRLADCAIHVQASVNLSREAALELNDSGPARVSSRALVAEAAYASRRAARRLVRDAHQVFGGVGFALEHDLQVFTRRLKSYSLLDVPMDALGEEILTLRYTD